jgi:large subunit ribosomal protein L19
VNRAKLYYLRGKVGKKARVRELRPAPGAVKAAPATEEAPTATEPEDVPEEPVVEEPAAEAEPVKQ